LIHSAYRSAHFERDSRSVTGPELKEPLAVGMSTVEGEPETRLRFSQRHL
jgi:hypothetical protein